jgi:hypothetical protein
VNRHSGAEQLVFEAENNPLSHPAEVEDSFVMSSLKRRIVRAREERAGDANPLQAITRNARVKLFDVDDGIRKLWHRARL